ncbi:hypothetical protein KEJ39_00530 [Candidatus Bathyarchaeota archaeon]|nr:hypothetical protein [Candidatus Bathyarchaeota archaeon]
MAISTLLDKDARRIECLALIVTKDGRGFYCRKSGGPCNCPDAFRRHIVRA